MALNKNLTKEDVGPCSVPFDRETVNGSLQSFVGYLLCFYAAWFCWVCFLYPRVIGLGEKTLAYALANLGFRLLIWAIPVILYLKYVDQASPLAYLKLHGNFKKGMLFGLGFAALNCVGTILRLGLPHVTARYVSWNSIFGTSLAVGFIEEIPFRGFIFQRLEGMTSFWPAAIGSSLLFLAIHIPGWISLRMLSAANAATVFFLGLAFAIVFRLSGSLWSSIIAHSLNDFMSFVIYHM